MAYITKTQLENFLTPETVFAIFNDNNAGTVDDDAVDLVLNIASKVVDSYLARSTSMTLPITGTPPEIVLTATLLWAKAFAFERHSEYVRMYGDGPRKTAEKLCENIAEGQLFITDSADNPTPTVAGGIINDGSSRIVIDSADGTKNSGDWG